jgi:hypothetical protein
MSSMTVSLEVPYAHNEKQFLFLAVQTAVRTFRSMNASSSDSTLSQKPSTASPSLTPLQAAVES